MVNETTLGFIEYGDKRSSPWYDRESEDLDVDGLVQWLNRIEQLGVPTVPTKADLPSAPDAVGGSAGTHRQFAAVAEDAQVYRHDGDSWVSWMGHGTADAPIPEQHVSVFNAEALGIGPGHIHVKPEEGTEGIKTAIQNLPAEGGLVTLSKGVYEVNTDTDGYNDIPIPIQKDNVCLMGQGRASEIFLPADSTETEAQGRRLLDAGTGEDNGVGYVDNVHLVNFAINGNYQNNGGSNIGGEEDGHNIQIFGSQCSVRSVWSFNSTGDGVELTTRHDPSRTKDNLVVGCHFYENQEQNIHLHGCWDSVFIGNTCRGEYSNYNVHFYSESSDTRGNLFAFNTVLESDNGGINLTSDEGTTFNAINNTVAFNLVRDNAGPGIRTDNENAVSNKIENNWILSNDGNGISLAGAAQTRIKNNVIADNGESGIWFAATQDIENVDICGNDIFDNNQNQNSYNGINLRIEGMAITNLRIERNNIIGDVQNHQYAIYLAEATAGTYEDVIIRDNLTEGTNSGDVSRVDIPAYLDRNIGMSNAVQAAPSSPDIGVQAVADGANWDPDGDGNGERVEWDGSAWQEVVDLPNLT